MSRFQTLHPSGEEDTKRVPDQNVQNKNAPATLFCQLSQPNLKQHRLAATSQRSRPCSCCRTTSRLRRGNGPASRSTLSGFLARSHLARRYLGDEGAARHFISRAPARPPTLLSRGSERALGARLLWPDSSPRCDVNANDTSAGANM